MEGQQCCEPKGAANSPSLAMTYQDDSRCIKYMGVSENSVPLNPMVNDHYLY